MHVNSGMAVRTSRKCFKPRLPAELFWAGCGPLLCCVFPEGVQRGSRGGPEGVQRGTRGAPEGVQRGSREGPEGLQRESRGGPEGV
jgi:hypothetical protein